MKINIQQQVGILSRFFDYVDPDILKWYKKVSILEVQGTPVQVMRITNPKGISPSEMMAASCSCNLADALLLSEILFRNKEFDRLGTGILIYLNDLRPSDAAVCYLDLYRGLLGKTYLHIGVARLDNKRGPGYGLLSAV